MDEVGNSEDVIRIGHELQDTKPIRKHSIQTKQKKSCFSSYIHSTDFLKKAPL